MDATSKLRVAIVGAGIAGLAAAKGLKDHNGVDVQIYEKASELREIGASIALGPNGLRTLEKLGVGNALDDSIAFRNSSGYPMIYRHWKTNEITSIDEHHSHVDPRHRTARFYRVHLQQALLAHISSDRIHLNKAFAAAQYNPVTEDVTITFSDNTQATADIVLAADGIRSAVRQFYVPNSAPKWTGWVAFRSVFSTDLVKDLDPAILNEANHWWGPESNFFSSRLGKDLFTIVGGYYSDPDLPEAPYAKATWNSDGDVDVLRGYYKDWHPVIQEMVAATPDVRQYPNTAAPGLESWIYESGRVTLAGDAAHAHGGALAAGGSLAIDDAYAFVTALWHFFPPRGRSYSKSDIVKALSLYEQSRKPHADRVIATVRAGNASAVARVRAGNSETDEQLRVRISSRADPFWIHEHDVDEALRKVVGRSEDSGSISANL